MMGPQFLSLALAYFCMVLLNLTTVLYAALIGPALGYIFSGDPRTITRGAGDELRPMWDAVPTGIVERLEAADPSAGLWLLPALIVVIATLKGAAHTGQFFLFGRASQHLLIEIRQQAFDALLRQTPRFFATRTHGDLLSRLTHDANDLERAVFYGYGSLLRDSLAVLALLAYLFYADPLLALVTVVTVPLAVAPLLRFARWMKRVSQRGQAAQAEISSVVHETLAGAQQVQAFGREAHESARLRAKGRRYLRQMLKSYFIRAVRTPTMEFLGALALASLFFLLASYVHSGDPTRDPAHYISFIGAIFLMYDPLKKLGKVSDYLAAGAAAAERIFEIVDLPPEIVDRPGAVALPAPDGDGGGICFDRVSFAYQQNGAPILRDVSLTIPPGACLALVGASGAGKSTIANLLPRFYEVEKGRISISNLDIRDATLTSLRRQISLVTQDTFLFNAKVADNIAYGAPAASRAQIEKAAIAAQAHDFITALPAAYDTIVGERGATLSGGERQRLAIARALLRDTPILILDEATSHLDVESERQLQKALEILLRGRTSLVIAHRLTTVRQADQICVLKDGAIVERGSHDELIAAAGEYARLAALQFSQA